MAETFAKKEKEKKKLKKKQDKAEKMAMRKSDNAKGRSLEEMFAYVGEDGSLSATPPDLSQPTELKLEDIQLGAAKREVENPIRKGTVSFINRPKGYGFIIDDKNGESVHVSVNELSSVIKENSKVRFEKQKTLKGFTAFNVVKI